MKSDIFYWFIVFILMGFVMFVAGMRVAQASDKQLEGLYGYALNVKAAKTKVQMIESNPRMYLYYHGKAEGLQLWEIQTLDRIINCESRWNPMAANPNSTAKGLAQFLNSSWAAWGEGSVYDPVENIRATVRYYKNSGTRPWVCS